MAPGGEVMPMDVDSDDFDEDGNNSDGNWSSGSSFYDDSDEESILTFDTDDDTSINFVRADKRRGMWSSRCYSPEKGPFSRPDGEGSWKMDPEDSYSDYTLIVMSKETEIERTYHVHKFTLAHGQCGCEYFAALFRFPCRENVDGTSRFTFPTEVTNAFPDFLDIIYNPGYMKDISLHFRKFEENLYGGKLLPLRSLALYFGCRELLSNISRKIKDYVNDINRGDGLWATAKIVAVLCEDETAEDAKELLGHIIQTLVRNFDRYSTLDENEKRLCSVIEAMSPGVLLSFLLQVTSTLTNRYRARYASVPFFFVVTEYLNNVSCISTWHFERIVLYLLDLILPITTGFADMVASCAKDRGMYTDFVKRILDGYGKRPLETIENLDIINRLDNSPNVKRRKITIEGKFEGNQSTTAVQFGRQALGGNQGDADFFNVETIPGFTLADLKAMVYDHIGLRPDQQLIRYKHGDGDLIQLKDTDTLESIETATGEVSLYLHAIPYCPTGRSTQSD